MADPPLPLKGGCHCGRLRFELHDRPTITGYCHCSICRRTTGAPVLAWAVVPLSRFAYVAGEPAVYRSSTNGERRFCPGCGAQVEFRSSGDDTVSINTALLDAPQEAAPAMHVWTDDAVAWLRIDDDLPRFPAAVPDA